MFKLDGTCSTTTVVMHRPHGRYLRLDTEKLFRTLSFLRPKTSGV
jgi:hypothetical protein